MSQVRTEQCQRCKSERIVFVSARAQDLHTFQFHHYEQNGFAPDDLGIGDGEATEFEFCLDCGQIQGDWPRPLTSLEKDHWDCFNCKTKHNTEDDKKCQYCGAPKLEVVD